MFQKIREQVITSLGGEVSKSKPGKATGFAFGDAEPVMDSREILDMFESVWNGRYFDPPIDRAGLAKTYNAAPHHASAIQVKANILSSSFIPNKFLSRQEFKSWTLNKIIFGEGYLERIDNRLGDPMRLKTALSKYTRRGEDDQYFYVPNWQTEHPFKKGSIFHLMQHDVNQELYGVPEYLAGLQSAWLNESATLFRRKYYNNGSHAGFILYMTDAMNDEEDIENLKTAMKNSKGPGNFKNMVMYVPGGKKDGVQVLPISEVQAKDEFFNIKNVTRDDQIAAHRVPPQLMAVLPGNVGGFGDVEKATLVFNRNEIVPMQTDAMELNEWFEDEIVKFDPYVIEEIVEKQKDKK